MFKLRKASDLQEEDRYKIHHSYCAKEEMDVVYTVVGVVPSNMKPSNDGSQLLMVQSEYYDEDGAADVLDKNLNENLPIWLESNHQA